MSHDQIQKGWEELSGEVKPIGPGTNSIGNVKEPLLT